MISKTIEQYRKNEIKHSAIVALVDSLVPLKDLKYVGDKEEFQAIHQDDSFVYCIFVSMVKLSTSPDDELPKQK